MGQVGKERISGDVPYRVSKVGLAVLECGFPIFAPSGSAVSRHFHSSSRPAPAFWDRASLSTTGYLPFLAEQMGSVYWYFGTVYSIEARRPETVPLPS